MTEERDFKGVWIPRDIWLDDRLNALDKVILTEIDSLDGSEHGCWASNKYIAEFCQCSESKVSQTIAKLSKLGYITMMSFDGRQREIKSNIAVGLKKCEADSQNLTGSLLNFNRQPVKKCEADSQNLRESNIDNNTLNNIENKKDYNNTPSEYMCVDTHPQTPSLRREKADYSRIVEAYNNICTSLPRVTTLSDNRKKAIAARLKTYTAEQFDEVFRKAEASRFLKGGNNRNWTASFDWLIKDANFAKVLDGNYDDSKSQTLPQQVQNCSSGGEIVTINGKEYIKKGLRYYIPNGSGIAVDPFAEDDLPY